MQALAKLLEANSDPSDTRYNILTADEVTEIVEWQNAQHAIACMCETYQRRRARKEAHPAPQTGEEYFAERRVHMRSLYVAHRKRNIARQPIDIRDVRRLRELTGVGPLYCKMALQRTGGNVAAGVAWLREHAGAGVVWA